MKYILLLISLFAFVLSAPKLQREIAVTDTFVEIRKNLLECIVETERSSPELKKIN